LFFIVPALVLASMTALHHDFASTTLAVVVDVLVVAAVGATSMSAATIAVGMTARIRAPFPSSNGCCLVQSCLAPRSGGSRRGPDEAALLRSRERTLAHSRELSHATYVYSASCSRPVRSKGVEAGVNRIQRPEERAQLPSGTSAEVGKPCEPFGLTGL
jgi:hypothetical protein